MQIRAIIFKRWKQKHYIKFYQVLSVFLNSRSRLENMGICRETYKCQGITHLENLSRKMLYSKIKVYEPRVEEKRRQRFVQLKKEYDRRFQNLVMDMLNDETVWSTDQEEHISEDQTQADEPSDELGWILETLKEIPINENGHWTESDETNIKHFAEQLMMNSTSKIENQTVLLPNVENRNFEKMLLKEACSRKVVPELKVEDINDVISNRNVPAPKCANSNYNTVISSGDLNRDIKPVAIFMRSKALPHLTFHDYVINSPTYHEGSGVEKCCEMDSASCMLTTALVSDRLEQKNNPAEYFKRIIRPT